MRNSTLITTSTHLEGYKIVKQLGLVRGITVRSRSILGNMAGGFMTIFGGRSAIYTELCENAREEAFTTDDSARCRFGGKCNHQYAV